MKGHKRVKQPREFDPSVMASLPCRCTHQCQASSALPKREWKVAIKSKAYQRQPSFVIKRNQFWDNNLFAFCNQPQTVLLEKSREGFPKDAHTKTHWLEQQDTILHKTANTISHKISPWNTLKAQPTKSWHSNCKKNEQATQNTILKNTILKNTILKKGRKNKYYETKDLVIWLDAIPSTTDNCLNTTANVVTLGLVFPPCSQTCSSRGKIINYPSIMLACWCGDINIPIFKRNKRVRFVTGGYWLAGGLLQDVNDFSRSSHTKAQTLLLEQLNWDVHQCTFAVAQVLHCTIKLFCILFS